MSPAPVNAALFMAPDISDAILSPSIRRQRTRKRRRSPNNNIIIIIISSYRQTHRNTYRDDGLPPLLLLLDHRGWRLSYWTFSGGLFHFYRVRTRPTVANTDRHGQAEIFGACIRV